MVFDEGMSAYGDSYQLIAEILPAAYTETIEYNSAIIMYLIIMYNAKYIKHVHKRF